MTLIFIRVYGQSSEHSTVIRNSQKRIWEEGIDSDTEQTVSESIFVLNIRCHLTQNQNHQLKG